MVIEVWSKNVDNVGLHKVYVDVMDEHYDTLGRYIAWTGPKYDDDNDRNLLVARRSPKKEFMYVYRNTSDNIDIEVWLRADRTDSYYAIREFLDNHGFTNTQSIW